MTHTPLLAPSHRLHPLPATLHSLSLRPLPSTRSERPIDEDFKLDFQGAYERFAFSGERVLAFAYAEFTPPREALRDPSIYKTPKGKEKDTGEAIEHYPTKGLVFAGLISLMDPPKEGTDGAIAICRDAYIKVVSERAAAAHVTTAPVFSTMLLSCVSSVPSPYLSTSAPGSDHGDG